MLCSDIKHGLYSGSHRRLCMLSARCREPRPSQFSPRLQVRVISTSNILFIYLFIYKIITLTLGTPTIDLFASRLNKQCLSYVSWRPDPEAFFIDAFSVDWSKIYFYAFTPFSLIGRCLDNIQACKAEGILVVPFWPSQTWYPTGGHS